MLKSLHDLIGHVQGRDAVRDMETGGHEVTLGRGETPWDEAFAILDDAKYGGWVTVRRTTGNHRRSEVANAVAYLRRVAEGG
jgi:sugar phosphate isomerase/epimerase